MPKWVIAAAAGLFFLLLDLLAVPHMEDPSAASTFDTLFTIGYIVCFVAALILLLLWLFAPNGRARY